MKALPSVLRLGIIFLYYVVSSHAFSWSLAATKMEMLRDRFQDISLNGGNKLHELNGCVHEMGEKVFRYLPSYFQSGPETDIKET
jgi:hypothetical protein